MKSPLRVFVWLAVIAASVAAGAYLSNSRTGLAASGGEGPARYLFIAGGSDPYWDLCIAGAEAAAERLGAEVDFLSPESEGEAGVKQQLDFLIDARKAEVSGVAVGPIDPSRATSLIDTLAESVTVVTIDSDAPDSQRAFYVGSSNYEAGEIAARMVRDALPDGGDVVALMASTSKVNATQRRQGLADALRTASDASDAKYRLVNTYMDGGDYERCAENVRRALEENPGLGAIVCTFGYHGPLALDALAEEESGDKVAVIAFDEDERVLAGIRAGRVHGAVVQDPFMFGYQAIAMLDRVRADEQFTMPIAGRVDVGLHCIPVTKENLDEFEQRLTERSSRQGI